MSHGCNAESAAKFQPSTQKILFQPLPCKKKGGNVKATSAQNHNNSKEALLFIQGNFCRVKLQRKLVGMTRRYFILLFSAERQKPPRSLCGLIRITCTFTYSDVFFFFPLHVLNFFCFVFIIIQTQRARHEHLCTLQLCVYTTGF